MHEHVFYCDIIEEWRRSYSRKVRKESLRVSRHAVNRIRAEKTGFFDAAATASERSFDDFAPGHSTGFAREPNKPIA
jgi:hypothetical protein